MMPGGRRVAFRSQKGRAHGKGDGGEGATVEMIGV